MGQWCFGIPSRLGRGSKQKNRSTIPDELTPERGGPKEGETQQVSGSPTTNVACIEHVYRMTKNGTYGDENHNKPEANTYTLLWYNAALQSPNDVSVAATRQ